MTQKHQAQPATTEGGDCAPPALRPDPPRPIPDWPADQTGRLAAHYHAPPLAEHQAGLARLTPQDRQPRADAVHARFDRTPPMPNKHADSHPSADSSVANTQRHTTYLELFCKSLGLHYTPLLNDRKRDYKRPRRKQSISSHQAKHHRPESTENISFKPKAAEVGLEQTLQFPAPAFSAKSTLVALTV